jgi:acetylornithine/N-succinyldiaminopimelate aminotransferase
MGLMQGVELEVPVSDIVKKALEHGLLIISAGKIIIRFVPPLVIEREDVDEMIRLLDLSMSESGVK